MPKPLKSNFATDGSLDTRTTLFSGKDVVATPILAEGLSASETESFLVDNVEDISNSGFAVIDDEIIFYSARFGKRKIRYLQRGMNGTVPSVHAVGAVVVFTPVYFVPPAFVDAVIEMQVLIRDHKDRLEKLEKK